MIYPDFRVAVERTRMLMKNTSYEVHPARWQGIDVSKQPAAQMREVLNVSFQVSMQQQRDLQYFRLMIQPNLPWADDHFEERVGGLPLNPGVQWRNWPWSNSADKFRTEGEGFTHTYMERYWPKYAGREDDFCPATNMGYRYALGDLNDVVELLRRDPDTRQAFLPIWFPEDTGVVHGGRVPCSLGHHFILRGDYLHHTYYIRSCDLYRHFQDDLYLSVRLHLWVLNKLGWNEVKPGIFSFHCVSLHMFINDYRKMFK